jgi:hypothetical protein
MIAFYVICGSITLLGLLLLLCAEVEDNDGAGIVGIIILGAVILFGWILIGSIFPVEKKEFAFNRNEITVVPTGLLYKTNVVVTKFNEVNLFINDNRVTVHKIESNNPYGSVVNTVYEVW